MLVKFLEEFSTQDYVCGCLLRVLRINHYVHATKTRVLHRFIFLEFRYLEAAPGGQYARSLRPLLFIFRIRLWLGFFRLIPIEATFIVVESRLLIEVNDLSLQVLLAWWAIKSVSLMLH